MSHQRYLARLEELEELRDSVAALEAELRIATGEEQLYSWDEVKAELDAISD
jgi:predicted DNA-binding protein